MACNDVVVGTISVGGTPLGIEIISGGTEVYVANFASSTITVIDSATSGTTTINLPSNPREIAWYNNKAFVSLVNVGQVITIDTNTQTTGTTISVGSFPFGVVYDQTNDYVYVSNNNSSNVSVINASTDSVIATISMSGTPYGIAWDSTNDRIYVPLNGTGDGVDIIDTTTNTRTGNVSGFTQAHSAVFNTNNNKLYVTDVTGGTGPSFVRVVDTSTNLVTTSIPVGNTAFSLGFDSVHNRVYVANQDDDTISIINCSTDTVCNTLSVGNGPFSAVYNPTDNYTYVTDALDGAVTLIEVVPDPTPTPTNTSTPTPTPTVSETSTPTPTPTLTTSETSTPTPTISETSTPTPTISETSTPTPTPTISETSTPTPTPTISQTSTATPTLTPTSTEVEDIYTITSCCDGEEYTIVNIPGMLNVGQTYMFSGITGLAHLCYTVTSDTFGPFPYYDASGALFMLQDDCNDLDCPTCPTPTPTITLTPTRTLTATPTLTSTPTQTPTTSVTATPQVTFSPTPTSTLTSTPTPTPSPTDFCAPKEFTISVFDTTPTPSPTPTSSPTPSPTNAISIIDTCTWVINNAGFLCNDIKRIQDCLSGNYYYTSEPLLFGSGVIYSGTTFAGEVNGLYRCLTYVDDTDGSATDVITNISATYSGGCSACITTPTPTPTNTATLTPTPSVTPTLTPTTTSSGELYYVYSACTLPKTMVVQTQAVPSISEGQVFQISGACWSYVGNFVDYIPPVDFIVYNTTGTYFSGASGPFSSCAECFLPTPTPTSGYRAWTVTWAWSTSCSPCELTDGGVSTTLYTLPSVNTLTNGVYVYTDVALTIPFSQGRYFRSGSLIFETLTGGEINQHCVVGGVC